MKITINGKKFELGKALNRTECKISYERVIGMAGVADRDSLLVSFKHKAGLSGTLSTGQKCVAPDGTAFLIE